MTDQQRASIKSVLSAALHNAKIVRDQLDSLANPSDESFPDFRLDNAIDEVSEAVVAIEKALKEL